MNCAFLIFFTSCLLWMGGCSSYFESEWRKINEKMLVRYKKEQRIHFAPVKQFYKNRVAVSACFSNYLSGMSTFSRSGLPAAEHKRESDKLGRIEKRCVANAPQAPRDRRSKETFEEYSDRKNDEWGERACYWEGFLAQPLRKNLERAGAIERQCLQKLELKRIRLQLERLNSKGR